MDKSINSFEMRIRIGYVIIYWKIIFFTNFFVIFRHYYDILLIYGLFFSNFSYISKYWNSDWIKLLVGNLRDINP